MQLTLDTFCKTFQGSYVCGMKEGSGQIGGFQVTNADTLNKLVNDLQGRELNVHFTPNAVIDLAERSRKTNIGKINAWYIDVDIAETKHLLKPEDLSIREKRKEEIFTSLIFEFDLDPSLVVESRNGYHVYWFADETATRDNFDSIQKALINKMLWQGADEGASKMSGMLKMPFTRFWKRGETGIHKPETMVGTYKKYSEKDMIVMARKLKSTKLTENLITLTPLPKQKRFKGTFNGLKDIKGKLGSLSGHPALNGEIVSFQRTVSNSEKEKYNVFFSGKPSPVWIDQTTGSIYSSSDDGIRTISDLLDWYIQNCKVSEKEKLAALKLIA